MPTNRKRVIRIAQLFTLLLAFSLLSIPASADNLLVNGSFESPVVPADSFCGPFADCIGYRNGVGDSIGGWLVIGNGGIDAGGNPIPGAPSAVMLLGNNYVEPNNATGAVLHFHPEDGFQSVDLTGEGNQGENGIKQTVATSAGSQYNLSFWLGHQYSQAPGYENGPALIALFIDGQLIGTFSNGADTINDVNWAPFNFAFTAATDSTVIAFLSETPLGNNFAGLDNVALASVPEPASLILLGSGLIATFRARKRR
jgi:hypothetical protein